jgi:hypothetical protein
VCVPLATDKDRYYPILYQIVFTKTHLSNSDGHIPPKYLDTSHQLSNYEFAALPELGRIVSCKWYISSVEKIVDCTALQGLSTI